MQVDNYSPFSNMPFSNPSLALLTLRFAFFSHRCEIASNALYPHSVQIVTPPIRATSRIRNLYVDVCPCQIVSCNGSTSYLKNIPFIRVSGVRSTWDFLAHAPSGWMTLFCYRILICFNDLPSKIICDIHRGDHRQKILESIKI
jgi:hypothetical protein